MWTTGMLKENAKSALKRFYWMGFLVCFVCAIVNGGIGSGSRVAFGNSGYTNNSSSKSGNFSYHDYHQLRFEDNSSLIYILCDVQMMCNY